MAKYVMKFGGTSLRDAESINRAQRIVSAFYKDKQPEQLIVVVSAAGKLNNSDLGDKVTNLLEKVHQNTNAEQAKQEVIQRYFKICEDLGVALPNNLLKELGETSSDKTDRDYSRIVSYGERLSSQVVNGAFRRSLDSIVLDFKEFGMITDTYKEAFGVKESTVHIEQKLKGKKGVIIIPGFLGFNRSGEVTTLGRDGSNYTATKVGEAILADGIYIFSDEPGVRRASPKIVPDAEVIEQMSYNEAIEFAELGAKIINAKSIGPAKNENIPLHIVDEDYSGTTISGIVSLEHQGAKIIASSPGHSILSIRYDSDKPGVLADVANHFRDAGINIEALADERHGLSIAYLSSSGGDTSTLLRELGNNYKFVLENSFARVSIIGEGMRNQVGLLAKVAASFGKRRISIEMISQALPQLNITTFIPQDYERAAVKGLYEDLFVNNHLST